MVRWSKPSGDYIMNFYRLKEVSCKKTESGEHMRCPRGRGRAQGGRARLPPSWKPRVLSGLLLIFLFSQIFQNREKLPLELFWSRFCYRTTYLFLLESKTFCKVSLMYSSRVTVSITLASTFIVSPKI